MGKPKLQKRAAYAASQSKTKTVLSDLIAGNPMAKVFIIGLLMVTNSVVKPLYSDVEKTAKKFAAFMQSEQLEPRTDIVGIFSKNNFEYFSAILACSYRSLANCSLYDTLGKEAVQHVCEETEMKLAIRVW